MGDKNEPHNDTPDLRDVLRSIDAIGEDQTGLGDSPSDDASEKAAETTTE